ncbi:MAG: proline hydroxylase [Proteobacteria bacterium ST_bin13]|nr:MAG: proline hydroxylase [Proteobacteria bacterium ST_bin13]
MDDNSIDARIAAQDWPTITAALDARGWAILPALIDPESARATAALFDDDARFRSRIVMARHGFGSGDYGYFAHPLPPLVSRLRHSLYPQLTALADRWHERLGNPARFPAAHQDYLARCHDAGQQRPTPLLLRYRSGDYNCLHQDLYGANVFPLQVAILLSRPGSDFTGGDFVITEQRPRQQSRVDVVPLGQGDAVIFAVNHRPVRGSRGDYRVTMRHGVATIRSGERHTLGIIFHDAQ